MAKAIALIATLDTKGREAAHLRDLIRVHGHDVTVIDTGILGHALVGADITREEVALAGGAELPDLIARGDKGHAMEVMIAGASDVVSRLCAQGRLSGAISIGGGQGTAIGTAAMQALPIGVPKLMVSTIASGRSLFEPYVGTTDMMLMHAVADIAGLNVITRRILANAAGAIVGMVEAASDAEETDRTVIGSTMLGLTTPCLQRAHELLEGWGYEVVAFHPNGTGGRCLERLIDDGLIRGALDVSTQELTGHVCHGLFDAGPERLSAAGRRGIPQVVAPGGTDYIVLGPASSLTTEQRRRARVVHNPNITLVRTSAEEMAEVGRRMARQLNRARGPTAVLIPSGGFSTSDRPGHPFYDPQADQALVSALESELRPGVELHKIEAHINDPPFSEALAQKMHEVMTR